MFCWLYFVLKCNVKKLEEASVVFGGGLYITGPKKMRTFRKCSRLLIHFCLHWKLWNNTKGTIRIMLHLKMCVYFSIFSVVTFSPLPWHFTKQVFSFSAIRCLLLFPVPIYYVLEVAVLFHYSFKTIHFKDKIDAHICLFESTFLHNFIFVCKTNFNLRIQFQIKTFLR